MDTHVDGLGRTVGLAHKLEQAARVGWQLLLHKESRLWLLKATADPTLNFKPSTAHLLHFLHLLPSLDTYLRSLLGQSSLDNLQYFLSSNLFLTMMAHSHSLPLSIAFRLPWAPRKISRFDEEAIYLAHNILFGQKWFLKLFMCLYGITCTWKTKAVNFEKFISTRCRFLHRASQMEVVHCLCTSTRSWLIAFTWNVIFVSPPFIQLNFPSPPFTYTGHEVECLPWHKAISER